MGVGGGQAHTEQRQHRSIGEVKQNRACGENRDAVIAQQAPQRRGGGKAPVLYLRNR
jgi:hypothetical protein